MTEAEWLACTTKPATMVAVVAKASARKRFLAAAGCCRLVFDHISDPKLRDAVAAVERCADGRQPPEGVMRTAGPESDDYWGDGLVAATNRAVAAALFAGEYGGLGRCVEWTLACASISAPLGQKAAALKQTRRRVCDLLREVVGNPFRPWKLVPEFAGGGLVQPDGTTVRLSDAARGLAAGVHADQAFDRLPILADALEESGVTDADLLAHCRTATDHVRGCWALDVALGRA